MPQALLQSCAVTKKPDNLRVPVTWIVYLEALFSLVTYAFLLRILGLRMSLFLSSKTRSTASNRTVKECTEEVAQAVTQASDRLPIILLCLPTALAARAMLNRRGIQSCLHIGFLPKSRRAAYAFASELPEHRSECHSLVAGLKGGLSRRQFTRRKRTQRAMKGRVGHAWVTARYDGDRTIDVVGCFIAKDYVEMARFATRVS